MFNFPWADLCSLQTPIIFVHLSLIISHSVAVLNWPSFLLGLHQPHPRQMASPSNSPRKIQIDHQIYHELIPRAALYFDPYFLYPAWSGQNFPDTWPTSPPPEVASHLSSSMAAYILSHLSVSFFYVFKHSHIYRWGRSILYHQNVLDLTAHSRSHSEMLFFSP